MISRRTILFLLAGGAAGTAVRGFAQTAAAGSGTHFTAVTDNVVGAKDNIRIDLTRWSTDDERNTLLKSWTDPGSVSGPGRSGPYGPVDDATNDPFGTFRGGAAGPPDPAAVAAGGGRGPGGPPGGGRGGGRLSAPKPTPEVSLTTALAKLPTVGYLWSSEVAGYAIHSAVRVAEADGSERILLVTGRRLGASNDLWTPTGAPKASGPAYDFSVIELRLNAKGEGEGRASLTGKIAVDSAAKTIGPENYSALPVVLKTVRRRTGK